MQQLQILRFILTFHAVNKKLYSTGTFVSRKQRKCQNSNSAKQEQIKLQLLAHCEDNLDEKITKIK